MSAKLVELPVEQTIKIAGRAFDIYRTDVDTLTESSLSVDDDRGAVVVTPRIVRETSRELIKELSYGNHIITNTYIGCNAGVEYGVMMCIPDGVMQHEVVAGLRELI